MWQKQPDLTRYASATSGSEGNIISGLREGCSFSIQAKADIAFPLQPLYLPRSPTCLCGCTTTYLGTFKVPCRNA